MRFANKQRRARTREATATGEVRAAPGGLGTSCTLVSLVEASCRWPIGDGVPYLFCNEQSLDLLPYCAEHARLAYK